MDRISETLRKAVNSTIKPKKRAIDYKHNYGPMVSVVTGGHWKDIPKPYVFYHPHPTLKRGLRVSVHKYWNVGQHFYASVTELSNYVWDSKAGHWAEPWDKNDHADYPALAGRSFSDKFDTHTEARNYVNSILKKHFSPDTHEVKDSSGYGKVSDFTWDWADDFDPNSDE